MTRYPQFETKVPYSNRSRLNTLQVCIPSRQSPGNTHGLWIVYIHGGAWRDPAIDASSFDALQSWLIDNDTHQRINGLASVNYRLSPYPAHKESPSDPSDPARNARHPEHIQDVLEAVLYLQQKYDFQERYILVGHSCGATLAFQVAMIQTWALSSAVVPPLAIIGVEGIYDIPKMLDTYKHISVYHDFVAGAFGEDPEIWKTVSPVNADFSRSWPGAKQAVLVHSTADELLGIDQRNVMAEALRGQKWPSAGPKLNVFDLAGLQHDEVWQRPEQLAAVIKQVVGELIAV